MTDEEVREALRLALRIWVDAKKQTESKADSVARWPDVDKEREDLDAAMKGAEDWAECKYDIV